MAVTSYRRDDIDAAHAAAIEIFNNPRDMWVIEIVTPILSSPSNVWYTFFVGPDGGRENYVGGGSDTGDRLRAEFRAWLKAQVYDEDDRSPRYAWVEVFYGDDGLHVGIVDDGDAERRAMDDD